MRIDKVGYDPFRQLTYIRLAVTHYDRTEPRCPTCGRAFDCCCEVPFVVRPISSQALVSRMLGRKRGADELRGALSDLGLDVEEEG